MSISRSTASCIDPLSIDPLLRETALLGSSAALERLRLQVKRIAPHFRTVLVRGETGTGKELTARVLHAMGGRADKPFVVYPSSESGLEESENSIDHVTTMSQQGTLFLDSVGRMTLKAQDQLLHAAKGMDLRIIASTNEDLGILVSTGRFRHELYLRLGTVHIVLPPLRERMEDLAELARYFLTRLAPLYGKSIGEIADEALDRMLSHHWPGNVGELENVMRDGVLKSRGGVLKPDHLPVLAGPNRQAHLHPIKGSVRLQDVVGRHVLRVLKDCGGNKLRAAELLDISRSTLYRMLDGASAGGLR